MNTLADIIPPQAVAHGVLAQITQTSMPYGVWLVAIALLIALTILLMQRKTWQMHWRRLRAMRLWLRHDYAELSHLLRKTYHLPHLRADRPPPQVCAASWQTLITLLEKARFSCAPSLKERNVKEGLQALQAIFVTSAKDWAAAEPFTRGGGA